MHPPEHCPTSTPEHATALRPSLDAIASGPVVCDDYGASGDRVLLDRELVDWVRRVEVEAGDGTIKI